MCIIVLVTAKHTTLKILLICKDEQQRILHFSVLNDPCEFCPCLVDAITVIRIDDEDETLRACESSKYTSRTSIEKRRRTGRGKGSRCNIATAASSPTRNRPIAAQHTRKVVSPQRTDLVLAADIPDVELCVFVGDSLDIEADGGDRGHVLVKLELIENGCNPLVSTGTKTRWSVSKGRKTYWSFQRHQDPT